MTQKSYLYDAFVVFLLGLELEAHYNIYFHCMEKSNLNLINVSFHERKLYDMMFGKWFWKQNF